MTWYEHIFGILAVITCCLLPLGMLGIAACMRSSQISREEEKYARLRDSDAEAETGLMPYYVRFRKRRYYDK